MTVVQMFLFRPWKRKLSTSAVGLYAAWGDDCLDLTKTQSTDFARATALLNAAQFMTQDMSCTGQDGDDNPTGDENVICSAFAGEAGECKIAVGEFLIAVKSQPIYLLPII